MLRKTKGIKRNHLGASSPFSFLFVNTLNTTLIPIYPPPPSFAPFSHPAHTMAKEEVMLDDKFNDEKFDCEDVEQHLELTEEEDSPIEEVRVTVPSKCLSQG